VGIGIAGNNEGRGRALARRLKVRPFVEEAADRVRFWIDSFSDPVYLPGNHLPKGPGDPSRAPGTYSRWAAIEPVVAELKLRDAVDIGCNTAWFTLRLAERGVTTIGIEAHPPYFRTAVYAARRSGYPNVGILSLTIDETNVEMLPSVDGVLFLSIWHHLVRSEGFDSATEILRVTWSRARRVLFFDTGQSEMDPDYGLPPMVPDPTTWLTNYLGEVCEGGTLRHLGHHHSGEGLTRNLFAVIRT
jgi:hypothetical protein